MTITENMPRNVPKESESLLQPIYQINGLLDNLYPGEYFNKKILFSYLAGALIEEYATIIVLSDYIEIARMFTEAFLNAFPSKDMLQFNGHTIKDLIKLGIKTKKIVYLTNFEKNRELIEDITLSDKDGPVYGQGLTIPKLTVVSVARKEEFYNKPHLTRKAIIIELLDTNDQSEKLAEFELISSMDDIVAVQKKMQELLTQLNKKVRIIIPYKNTLMSSCYSHIIPNAFIDHNKFSQLIRITAFLNQSDRESHDKDAGFIEIKAHSMDIKYAKTITKNMFFNITKDIPDKIREMIKFVFSWVNNPKNKSLPGGFHLRKKVIDWYINELNLKIDLITRFKKLAGITIDEGKFLFISKKSLSKKEIKLKYSTFQRLLQLNINRLAVLDESKIEVHDRKTYEGYFKTLSVESKIYNYLIEKKSGVNIIFRLIKAPPLKDFKFSEIEHDLEIEYDNYKWRGVKK